MSAIQATTCGPQSMMIGWSRIWRTGFLLAGALFMTTISQAQLVRVGPVDRNNGFPAWYQDFTGLALNACLPNSQELADGSCLVTGDQLTNPSAPIAFPNNFPDEFFFSALDAGTPVNGGRLVWRARLEGAFANGPVLAGDQMVFARVRVTLDVPAPGGTYTVTHPFGVEVFPDIAPGPRGIFFTNDVGLTAGVFADALHGQITAFLRPSDVPGGNPLPPVLLPGGHTFLADPAALVPITGSPFGTNFVRVDGPNIGGPGIDTVQVDLFNVMGQVHTQPIPSQVDVTRATYRRTSSSAQADVFATAIASIGSPAPVLSVTGPTIQGMVMTNSGSSYFGEPVLRSPNSIPASLLITNSSDTPTSFTEANLVDEVHISTAAYNEGSHILTVRASSGDQLSPPTLVAVGFGPLDASGNLSVPNVSVPPATVTVISSAGGQDTEAVSVTAAGANNNAPFADNDVITLDLPADQPSTINILVNDVPNQNVTPRILANPVHGTVTLVNGSAVYTPSPAYSGPDSFSYINTDANNVDSNVALVSFNVAFVNHAPVAGPDSATAGINVPVIVDVLANDSDPDAGDTINPATVTIVSPPSSGTATANPDGTIRFTPTAGGIITLQYTVQDSHGLASNPTTVTITVTNPDIITITLAQFRTQKRDWRIRCTDTIPGPGNTITIHNGPTLASPILGTIAVDVAGAWDFVLKGSSVSPGPTNTVSIESTKGGQRLAVPLQITN